MKPIKMILSAIGPYASIQEIDFEYFGQNRVVLITGEIGTGKTFLFDSISFALFGEMSGEYRKPKSMRSQYASETVDSYVDFYFSHQGKEYHVYRTPAYERAKKRGTGTVDVPEEASLFCDGELLEVKSTKVNKMIIELLGIDYKQFKQIAMIAQGEFQKLLNASTGEWTEILRSVFMTDGYKQMGNLLKEKQDAAVKEWERQKDRVIQLFQTISASGDSKYREKLKDLKQKMEASDNVWNVDEMVELVRLIQEEDEEKKNGWKRKLEQLQETLNRKKEELAVVAMNNGFLDRYESFCKEKQKLDEQKTHYEEEAYRLSRRKDATYEILPGYRALSDKEKMVSDTGQRLKQEQEKEKAAQKEKLICEEEFAAANLWKEKAESLKKQAEKMSEELEGYEQREKLRHRLKMLEEEKGLLEEEESRLNDREKKLKETMEGLEADRRKYEKSESELVKLSMEKQTMEQSGVQVEHFLARQYTDWLRQKEELKSLQNRFTSDREEFEAAREKFEHADRIRENNRAGLLASKLKDGMCCPVCGSTTHPKKAVLQPEAISEEEYKSLKAHLTAAEQRKQDSLLKVEAENTSLKKDEELLLNFILQFAKQAEAYHIEIDTQKIEDAYSGVKQLAEYYQKRLADYEAKEEILQREKEIFENAGKALIQARGEQTEQLQQDRQSLLSRKEKHRTDYMETTTLLNQFASLVYPDKKTAEEEQGKLAKEADRLLEAIHAADLRKRENEKLIAGTAAAVQTLKHTLDSRKKEVEDAKKVLTELLAQKEFSDIDSAKKYFSDQTQIARCSQELEDYRQRVRMNEEQLKQAKEDVKGKERKDEQALREEVEQRTEQVNSLSGVVSELEYRIRENGNRLEQIVNILPQLESMQDLSARYIRLYKLVSGNIGNTSKISLEQYVQTEGFEGIIAAANRRLERMSLGRYVLYRREIPMDKKRSSILDLDVLDRYTGYKRPVNSLSGGESFIASLCLALGMSDTVSSNLGGIQMDALFIDEGFGTLDADTIDCAVGALTTLSNTNKFVGIISHRPELKESIPDQMIVSKSQKGSRIEYQSVFS